MIKLIKKYFSSEKNTHPFSFRGNVHIVERNGGVVEVHPTAFLNSLQIGYHVGMPFETTLIADAQGALIKVGENCRIHGTYVHAWRKVHIGRNVLIAAGTNIVDSNGHSSAVRYSRFRQYFKDEPKPIIIGDYVWIGMNSMILKGVEIGECAIVAAGSVVKDSVPAFAVVEGNPARIIRMLDPEEALEGSCPLEDLSREKGFYKY